MLACWKKQDDELNSINYPLKMKIIILGNGISGITAARFIRKLSDHRITVISEEHPYFFSRTALMYAYMGHIQFEHTQPYENWFWEKNRIELRQTRVETIDFPSKTIYLSKGEPLQYDQLVLACGSIPNKFGWKGQDLDGVHGLYHKQDLEAMERHTKSGIRRAVVVGGGLIGIEMAEMFHSRHIPVTILVREASYWSNILPPEESQIINRHIREHGFDLQLNTELHEIQGNSNGKVTFITTKNGERIACDFVGLTAGVRPNIDFLKNSGLEINKGILVDAYLRTNISDVFAIGDCAEIRDPQSGRKPIEAVWYTGRMAGETVAYNICGQKVRYNPNLWFNSAKFLDIEYQVYGDISAKMPMHQAAIYWEHAKGKKSVRIVFDKNTQNVVGFNLMGIRYRHEVCEKWILEQTNIETVLQNLALAHFDPEFFKTYQREIVAIYNQQFGKNLATSAKSGLNSVLRFLRMK
jgi:NADPH-dependent 2,4-dienoyl-CoA reductase/sulfur reductase-like enzyme